MSIELKIKSKHLSQESKIIRFEEHKLTKQIRWLAANQKSTETAIGKRDSLSSHRRVEVRNENRATFVARAYISGKPYSSVESKRKKENEAKFNYYILPRALSMIKKYHPQGQSITKEMLQSWIEA